MASNDNKSPAEIYNEHLGGVFETTRNQNRQTLIQNMIRRELVELCVNRFQWTGLPSNIDVRFLEMTLFSGALATFYFDVDYASFLALKSSPVGPLDPQNNPKKFQVYGNQFINKTLDAKDCVPIWANYTRIPDVDVVAIYSQRLAELDRTIEINSMNARETKTLVASKDTQLSMINLNRQHDEGVDVITVRPSANTIDAPALQNIAALDLGSNPDSIEKLSIVRTRLWNECMGMLGINHANQDKKERLVASEVGANDEQVDRFKFVNLNARRMAAQQINDKFGLAVSVDYHYDVSEYLGMGDADAANTYYTANHSITGDNGNE